MNIPLEPNLEEEKLTAERKALLINLDKKIFGTFAEIGAGQEVARNFFKVGGAAGTVAKTMSAYDMTFSDSIYGKVGRYVSKERLNSMLQHEYVLLLERLSNKRGTDTQFFVFANTVAAKGFKGNSECHGWLGIRFQPEPLKPANDIIIHVRMTDKENLLQQQALGAIGVNLIYGAFFDRNDPEKFVQGLLDGLTTNRIEVDMIEFSGPDMKGIDNRLMSLKLLQKNLTNAIMFAADGRILQPSEILYKKPVLIERGSFRPVTHINLDMMKGAKEQFSKEESVQGQEPIVLFEITLNNLLAAGALDDQDFLARADTLSALGYNVLISNYPEYHRLSAYFRRYTKEMVGMVMGINTLLQIFNEKHYENLEGGILEAMGRLFAQKVKLYIYPMTKESYEKYVAATHLGSLPGGRVELPELVTAKDVKVLPNLKDLYSYLLNNHAIEAINEFTEDHLTIFSREVLSKIQSGDQSWTEAVPAPAAAIIKDRGMFSYKKNK
ncbi:MAG: TonB-dependent receptor [bacterium]|nr:TonB-dependent receptor [bacterium]